MSSRFKFKLKLFKTHIILYGFFLFIICFYQIKLVPLYKSINKMITMFKIEDNPKVLFEKYPIDGVNE